MTRGEIRLACIANRFDPSNASQINDWIRAREAEVWQFTDWPIKNTSMLTLSVTSGVAPIPMPTGMSFPTQAIRIYDSYGSPLRYMDQDAFFDVYQPITVGASSTALLPEAWTYTSAITQQGATVYSNPQIRIGPTTYTGNLTLTGWTLPIKRVGDTTWTVGTMSVDSDIPWWPDDFHYLLVAGASALGSKLLGGLDYQPMEDEFHAGLQRLKDELMPGRRDTLTQWSGAYTDTSGY